jgi:hypothetical protein
MEHMIVKRILDIGLFDNQIEAAVKVRKNSNRLTLLPLKKNNSNVAAKKLRVDG